MHTRNGTVQCTLVQSRFGVVEDASRYSSSPRRGMYMYVVVARKRALRWHAALSDGRLYIRDPRVVFPRPFVSSFNHTLYTSNNIQNSSRAHSHRSLAACSTMLSRRHRLEALQSTGTSAFARSTQHNRRAQK